MTLWMWAALTALIWGIVPILEKWGLAGATAPSVGVFLRSAGVAVGALLVALAAKPWAAMAQVPRRSILLLAAGGFLASFVGQMAFYHALKHGEVSRVAPLVGTYPLVAAVLGWWLLHEPLTVARAVGVLLVVGGVALLR